ncbi:hypothetical protein [Chelativorans sp. YIM 93263]|nr:hypothetical protein [Chelativorans sp. YIM 93263]
MKKLLIAAVSALGLFALAACEGGEAPPDGDGAMDGGAGTTDPAQPAQ